MNEKLIKGRGSQFNVANPFNKQHYYPDITEELDKNAMLSSATQFFIESPKKIISKSESPDLGVMHSLNPYQGCEHGCIYCYARNSHNYWGFSAGLDFESKIIVKKNAPQMLEDYLCKYQGPVTPILLSGNTDCYQPAERHYRLTRRLLQIFYQYRYPVNLITKNSLILRDLELLIKLANKSLVQVFVSITTLQESIRNKMEPRTATAKKRLEVVEKLADNGVPVGVMIAPIIPGLTDHEIPAIIKETAARGALTAGYTIVRLNGTIATLFEDWVNKTFPGQADKILNQIAECHDGNLNDSEWHRRLKGSGRLADIISQIFKSAFRKHYGDRKMPEQDTTQFRRGGNYSIF